MTDTTPREEVEQMANILDRNGHHAAGDMLRSLVRERTIDAINAGENRYRQTVLGQATLPGYPTIEQPPAPAPDDPALREQVCAEARRENANRRVTTADLTADAQAVMGHARFATGQMSPLQRAHLAGIAARMENFASTHDDATLRDGIEAVKALIRYRESYMVGHSLPCDCAGHRAIWQAEGLLATLPALLTRATQPTRAVLTEEEEHIVAEIRAVVESTDSFAWPHAVVGAPSGAALLAIIDRLTGRAEREEG